MNDPTKAYIPKPRDQISRRNFVDLHVVKDPEVQKVPMLIFL